MTDELRQAARATDALDDGIDEVRRSTDKAADQAQRYAKTVDRDAVKATDKLKGRVKQLATVIVAAFAVQQIARFAASTVKAASDLEESANAVSVVFEGATATIEEFGQTAATSVGLAQAEFNALATNTGALLTNFGFSLDEAADSTIILTQRAADLASVFNTEVGEALDAINAALRGETEPIRRYGISLSAVEVAANAVALGLASSTSAIDTNAKAASAVNLILEQSSKVAGDFANTSEGLANQQRILQARLEDVKAEIGQAFVPALLSLTTAAPLALEGIANLGAGVAELVQFLIDLPSAVQVAVVALAALGLAALSTPLAALVAIGAVLVVIGENARDFQSDIDRFADSLIRFGEISPEDVALSFEVPEKDIGRLAKVGLTVEDVAAALADGTVQSGEFLREIERLNKEFGEPLSFIRAGSDIKELEDSLGDAGKAFVLATAARAEHERGQTALIDSLRIEDAAQQQRLARLREVSFAEGLAGEAARDLVIQQEAIRAAFLTTTEQIALAEEAAALLADRFDELDPVLRELAQDIDVPIETLEELSGAFEAARLAADDSLVGIVDGLTGAVDPITAAGEEVALSVAEFVSNLDAQVRQLEEFEGRLVLLAAQGFDNLSESLRRKGPELSQIAGEFLADPLQAQVAEDLLAGKGTEVGDEYGAQIAEALAQFDFDDPALIAVLSFAESLSVPSNVAIVRSSFQALLDSAFSGADVIQFPTRFPPIDQSGRTFAPGTGPSGVTGETGGVVVQINNPIDPDIQGNAAQAGTTIAAIVGATGQFRGRR